MVVSSFLVVFLRLRLCLLRVAEVLLEVVMLLSGSGCMSYGGRESCRSCVLIGVTSAFRGKNRLLL